MDNEAKARDRALQYEKVMARQGIVTAPVEWDSEARTWDLRLRYGGAQLLVVIDADDPEFVCVLMPNFWAFTPEESPAILRGIAWVNRACKCGKLQMNGKGDDVSASAEFLDTHEDVDAHSLLRYLDMTIASACAFAEFLQPQALANLGRQSMADSTFAAGEPAMTHTYDRLH